MDEKNFRFFITHLRFEALALGILMVVLTHKADVSLWILPITFLLFDLCMLGYAISAKVGSIMYNMVHDLTIPTLFIAVGVMNDLEFVSVVGFCWTFHIAVDRFLGYGLKHGESFKHTHLGKIGK